VYNDNTFGFLRLTISPTAVAGVFVSVDPKSGATGVGDSFTVDLHASTVSSGGAGKIAGASASGGKHAPAKPKKANRRPAKAASNVSRKRPKAKAKSTAARTKRGGR
jgi:hypothetical protein